MSPQLTSNNVNRIAIQINRETTTAGVKKAENQNFKLNLIYIVLYMKAFKILSFFWKVGLYFRRVERRLDGCELLYSLWNGHPAQVLSVPMETGSDINIVVSGAGVSCTFIKKKL